VFSYVFEDLARLFDGDPLATLCTTARKHLHPIFGLHAGPKAVNFHVTTLFGLVCTLWHVLLDYEYAANIGESSFFGKRLEIPG